MILVSEISIYDTMSKEELLNEVTFEQHRIKVCKHNDWFIALDEHETKLSLIQEKLSKL